MRWLRTRYQRRMLFANDSGMPSIHRTQRQGREFSEDFAEVRQRFKTLGVRLSETGDARARTLAALPALGDAIAVLGTLADVERTDAACGFFERTWLPETTLAGVHWGDNAQRHKFVEVEENPLPALVRGWAESDCSVRGHCWYALASAGREQLGKSIAASALPPVPQAVPVRRGSNP